MIMRSGSKRSEERHVRFDTGRQNAVGSWLPPFDISLKLHQKLGFTRAFKGKVKGRNSIFPWGLPSPFVAPGNEASDGASRWFPWCSVPLVLVMVVWCMVWWCW
eukprot:FR739255.1.p2 GENE.FR739255.1~~FR739255.1.p2  ORF type:complete len:104 (+),score=8.78 FR739255.1:84-395(+)